MPAEDSTGGSAVLGAATDPTLPHDAPVNFKAAGQAKANGLPGATKNSSELVAVLGGVSAAAMASMICSAQATPALADALAMGNTGQTLRLLAQIAFARSAAGILVLPAIGRMADRYGRKGMLAATAFITACGHALCAAFPTSLTLILRMLLRERVVPAAQKNGPVDSLTPLQNYPSQALVGSLAVGGANDAIRDAALADVLTKDALASATAKARAFMALGMIGGPLLGGIVAKRNIRYPFVAAAAMSLCGSLLASTQMTETLPPTRRIEVSAAQDREGGVFALNRCLNPLSSIELLRRSPRLRWLTLACALSMGSEFHTDVTPLFCRDRLKWDSVEIGKFSASGGIFAVLSSASCSTVLKLLGPQWLTLGGTAAHILRNVLMSQAYNATTMHASNLGILFGGVTMRLSSLLSKHTEMAVADGFGGGEATAMRGNSFALMRLIIPIVATRLYGPGTEGWPYLFSASLAVGATGVLVATGVSAPG